MSVEEQEVFKICSQVDSFIAKELTESIVIGTSYDMLEAHHGILPISRNCFYRNTGYRMAVDLYRNENIGSEAAAVGAVSSITEGDTSTSFRQYVDDNFKDTVLKNYKPSLNRYRKVAWR